MKAKKKKNDKRKDVRRKILQQQLEGIIVATKGCCSSN